MTKERILFVKKYNTNPKFMTNDFDILSRGYIVTLKNVKTTNNIFIISALISEFFYLLFNIWQYKIIYIWFADYHSFLPVLFAKLARKKSVICAGGYECTYIPEIKCGVFTYSSFKEKVRAFCASYSLKNCTIILPVDDSLIENTNTYIYSGNPDKPPLKDGIKNFIPGIETNFETVYLGYDPDIFFKPPDIKKERTVLSAGLIVNDDEFKRKGFDLLINAAKVMTDVNFVLIGFNSGYYGKIINKVTPNVKLVKITDYNTLIAEYRKAKVFAQISMFEGMPSTLCEAMMCECIPVGSNVNGIPKIIGDTGFIVYKKNIDETMLALSKAVNAPDSIGIKARQRVLTNFSLDARKDKLLNVLNSLIS